MTKLTNAMRDKIRNRILEKVCIPRDLALRRKENALALRILKSRFGSDVFEKCRAMPEGWLPLRKALSLDSSLTDSFPRWRGTTFWFQGRLICNSSRSIELAEYTPLPDCAKEGWDAETVRGKNLDELHAWYQGHYDLAEQLANLSTQLRATLAAFTTVEKLAEGWPEGYAELPAEMLAVTGGLPAPRIADLNARITALREAA